jgi:hypothetical protein
MVTKRHAMDWTQMDSNCSPAAKLSHWTPLRASAEDLRAKVIAAWQAGHSPSEVAAQAGLSRRTVRRWVREWIDGRLHEARCRLKTAKSVGTVSSTAQPDLFR